MKNLTTIALALLFAAESRANHLPTAPDSLRYPFNQMRDLYVKPYRHPMPTYYVSGYLGGSILGEQISATANVSAGVQLNKWVGFGVAAGLNAATGACCGASFGGIGLQYRLHFPWHAIWSIDYGLGFGPSKGNDYYGYYRPSGKPFPYYKWHVGRRFGNAFTLGACIFGANPDMEFWDNDHTASGAYHLTGNYRVGMGGAAVTVGVNLH